MPLLFLAIVSAIFFRYPQSQFYIKKEIRKANFCQVKEDCVSVGNTCPFGCYIYVNKDKAEGIRTLIDSYLANALNTKCVYGCISCPEVRCVENKCQAVCDTASASRKQANDFKMGPGDYDFKIDRNGTERFYLLHVPEKYDQEATPLVLAFHGGMGNSRQVAENDPYRVIAKSDKEGFIVAIPNGSSRLKTGKLATWNAGDCCGYSRDNDIDDVGFVKTVLDDIRSKFNIDEKRIYATGFSNGGMFSYRLACDMADEFAAIAAVSGTDNYGQCKPGSSIPVMHIHAKDDANVLFAGGAGSGGVKDEAKVTDFRSVENTVSRWVERNGCAKAPRKVLENRGAYCELYSECKDGAEVKLCVTETGGHSWPGGISSAERGVVPSTAISATDEIWKFFKDKSR